MAVIKDDTRKFKRHRCNGVYLRTFICCHVNTRWCNVLSVAMMLQRLEPASTKRKNVKKWLPADSVTATTLLTITPISVCDHAECVVSGNVLYIRLSLTDLAVFSDCGWMVFTTVKHTRSSTEVVNIDASITEVTWSMSTGGTLSLVLNYGQMSE